MSTKPFTCYCCNKPCSGTWEDVGYGPLEFWGNKFTDSSVLFVSECCGIAIMDDDNNIVGGSYES